MEKKMKALEAIIFQKIMAKGKTDAPCRFRDINLKNSLLQEKEAIYCSKN